LFITDEVPKQPTAANRRTEVAMRVMRRIGTQLLEERKAAALYVHLILGYLE
jgi:hypothetical protein